MSRLNFHNSLLTMSFGMTFAVLTVVAQTQTLPHDMTVGHLETVATFNDPMPTGVTVSRTNRIFVNFPRWGDDVPFTVAEVTHGKTVAYPDATVNDWPGRKSADPTQYRDQTQNENQFVSVQSVVVDPANRLWVLDTGSPMLKNALLGGPNGKKDSSQAALSFFGSNDLPVDVIRNEVCISERSRLWPPLLRRAVREYLIRTILIL